MRYDPTSPCVCTFHFPQETKTNDTFLGSMNPTLCSYKSKKETGKENALSPVTQPLSSSTFLCVPNVYYGMVPPVGELLGRCWQSDSFTDAGGAAPQPTVHTVPDGYRSHDHCEGGVETPA